MSDIQLYNGDCFELMKAILTLQNNELVESKSKRALARPIRFAPYS